MIFLAEKIVMCHYANENFSKKRTFFKKFQLLVAKRWVKHKILVKSNNTLKTILSEEDSEEIRKKLT